MAVGVKSGAARDNVSSDNGRRKSVDTACNRLNDFAPHLSSKHGLTKFQKCTLIVISFVLLASFIIGSETFMSLIQTVLILGFSLNIALRLLAIFLSILQSAPPKSDELVDDDLPTVTILAPMYKEAEVVGQSIEALSRTAYPAHKLQILYLLEEDDIETISAFKELKSDLDFQVLIVPHAAPRTKPKALNYGLQFARGEFVCVFDAEDWPGPNQIRRAVQTFKSGAPELAVIQAPLFTHNRKDSWLAAQFELEYALHFGLWLPMISKLNWPIPLGGTSNYFRRSHLETVHAWDPYNVTEDADLGYRLARAGFKSALICEPTLEEAPLSLTQWVPQRTRWIKGHLQTLIVLLRAPGLLVQELGIWRTLGLFSTFGGSVAASAIHGPALLIMLLGLLTDTITLGWMHWAVCLSGYFSVAMSAVAIGSIRQRVFQLATVPFYWPLQSYAFLCALWELRTKPHIWSKTRHGLSRYLPA